MGITKSMSHVKRVRVVCCTKTLPGGDVVLVSEKDQGFLVSPLHDESGCCIRRKQGRSHLEIARTNKFPILVCFSIKI